jgi:uncharacterized membrane protein (DUF4010 family)
VDLDFATSARLAVALLGGAAIGLERQWSGHASGPLARFGGIRTFALLGALGGLSGWMAAAGLGTFGAVLLGGGVVLVAAAYVAASRSDIDGTTETAGLIVLAAGALAGAGYLMLASAVVAGTVVLLLEKTRLHALVARIDDQALRASARFAALACVILPLLPAGPFGPFDAVRPRELWALVLFFSGLSFLGWIARRMIGAHQGVIVSGLLGGLVSSTSVSLTFARESRGKTAPRLALAGGVVAACTVMLLRVSMACAVLNPTLLAALPRYIGGALAIGATVVVLIWRAQSAAHRPLTAEESPLQLMAALQMTALFQVVLFVIVFVRTRLGAQALLATAALVGLTDLDALTLSLARSSASANATASAATALAVGILSNTALKLCVAAAVGRGAFRMVTVGALGAMAAVTAVALLL